MGPKEIAPQVVADIEDRPLKCRTAKYQYIAVIISKILFKLCTIYVKSFMLSEHHDILSRQHNRMDVAGQRYPKFPIHYSIGYWSNIRVGWSFRWIDFLAWRNYRERALFRAQQVYWTKELPAFVGYSGFSKYRSRHENYFLLTFKSYFRLFGLLFRKRRFPGI